MNEYCCSCHISPPCDYCINLQECEQCGNIYHKSEFEDTAICNYCAGQDDEIPNSYIEESQ